ncbi:MAG: helix-turn-helix transcriptional regulator [Streptosporangiaceae bacterium]|nr:helix-turn-helix transcriptional regulator [Streptosporangiaceae bacterium]
MSDFAAAQDRPAPARADDCCAPLLGEPLTAGQAARLSRTLKAVADPTRLRLVSIVAAHEGGEACVCDLTALLGLTQPTISHHLKILVDAGILTRDKRGVWAYYAVRPAALRELAAALDGAAPQGVRQGEPLPPPGRVTCGRPC